MSKASTKSIPLYDRFEREMALFGRHVKILSLVYQKNPIGILRLSRDTGLPMHKIRYSLKILEEEGLIEAKTVGAIPTEQSGKFLKTLTELVSRFKQEFDGLEQMIQTELSKEQR
jgi:predicted transcriptional regulator